METTNVIERVMETPFSDAIQSIWVIGVMLLLICYSVGIIQCRRLGRAIGKNNPFDIPQYNRMPGEMLATEKWLIFCLFVLSPIWAPITLLGEGIGRGSHALVITAVDQFLTAKTS